MYLHHQEKFQYTVNVPELEQISEYNFLLKKKQNKTNNNPSPSKSSFVNLQKQVF